MFSSELHRYLNRAQSNYRQPNSFLVIHPQTMHFESNRLATFKNWPLSYINKEDLAREGFFYLITGRDTVKCHFCYGTLFDWQRYDNPRFEHLKYFPACPLLKGKPTLNEPIVRGELIKTLESLYDITLKRPTFKFLSLSLITCSVLLLACVI